MHNESLNSCYSLLIVKWAVPYRPVLQGHMCGMHADIILSLCQTQQFNKALCLLLLLLLIINRAGSTVIILSGAGSVNN